MNLLTLHLGALGFAAPAMLAGGLLVSLPVIAHLLHRHARRELVFPSIMLVRSSVASQSSLYRLRRWLLLILRALAVVLIVGAFAQPMWKKSASAVAPDASASVVLVIDASASVAQRHGGLTGQQVLRTTALRAIDELQAGTDQANVIFAGGRPETVAPALTANLMMLREAVEQFEAGQARADLIAAIALAGEQIRDTGGVGRIVVISDLQQSNWQAVNAETITALGLGDAITLQVMDFQMSPMENVSVVRPRLTPEPMIIDRAGEMAADVVNHTRSPRTVLVRGEVDGRTVGETVLEVGVGESREVRFAVTARSSAPMSARIEIEEDGLAADNAVYFALRAQERAQVLVVADENPDLSGTSAYHLTRALAPRGGERDEYEVRAISGAELSAVDLSRVRSVLVGNTAALPESGLAALLSYVRDGGGVLWFSGRPAARDNFQRFDALAQGGAMPWRVQAYRDLAASNDYRRIGEGQWESPLLDEFDLASQAALGRVPIYGMFTVAEVSEEARVWLRFADGGEPALGGRRMGLGQVMVANFGAALSESELPKRGAFVALVHCMLRELTPKTNRRHGLVVGQSAVLSTPRPSGPDAAFTLVNPDGRALTDAEFQATAESVVLRSPPLTQRGIYEVRYGDQVLGATAVNLDGREGQAGRIDVDAVVGDLASAVRVARRSGQTEAVLDLRGRPLWGWAVLLACGCLAIEMALLAWWRR